MIAIENHSVKYFRAPKNYFWQWAENGTVIEWPNGNTICYREELITLLQQVNSGLPPLSPLLLLLTACQRPLHVQDKFFLIREVNSFTGESESSTLTKTLDYALKFLDIVAELPVNLRTGKKRVHLIYEIFSESAFTFASRQLNDAIQELNSGRMDKNVFHYFSEKTTEEEFTRCLLYFCTALQKFPTVQSLVTKLRTGLDMIPEAAPLLLPEGAPLSLYDQLLQDPKTTGIARLSKRLTAALNIPMQSKGSSDQPFGGISDITNRGNYDKLLLSELAHDDELLMARLVNNEALYFKREEPPENPKRQRIILMDTTLKMWGTSRVFALAAGLACAGQNKHSESLQAFTLGGAKFIPVSLNSKHGIIQALEMLDPALDCGKALEEVILSIPSSAKNEFIFITDARLLHNVVFHTALSAVKSMISFIITVTEAGELHVYECINGISKLISSAKIDVDELLSAPHAPKAKSKSGKDYAPAFLLGAPTPLYFPTVRMRITPEKLFVKEKYGAVFVNETNRVLFISKTGKAATELMVNIEKGGYTFGVDSNNEINILVSNEQRPFLKLYKINPGSLEIKTIDLSTEIRFAKKAVFKESKLYIQNNYAAFIFDCIAEVIVDKKEYNGLHSVLNSAGYGSDRPEFNKLIARSEYPLCNESIFYRIKNIHVNNNGQLVFGKRVLSRQNQHISLIENCQDKSKNKAAKVVADNLNLLQNKNLKFMVWAWDDGSEAVIDPRGLVHLKSSDTSLPEITIVMVLDKVTTCWASDYHACGSSVYINEKMSATESAEKFYNYYIQKFINRLI